MKAMVYEVKTKPLTFEITDYLSLCHHIAGWEDRLQICTTCDDNHIKNIL